MCQFEVFVDVFQWYGVGDYWVDFDFVVYILVDDFGYIGLVLCFVKGCVFLDLVGDKLEGLCVDFCVCCCYVDDD